MCGRFTIIDPIESIMERYLASDVKGFDYRPNYNVAPMQFIPSIIATSNGNCLGSLRWGLVPSWAKDDKIGSKMINARAETLTEKPAFRRLVSTKRCIIPCSGFYEWKKDESGKQPMRILMRDGSIFSLAGLYDTWLDPDGNKLSTCTIITTEPNSLMAEIHNRMPAIIRPQDESEWLNRETDNKSVTSLLRTFAAEEMRAYKVDSSVGNVRNNNKDLIQEVS
ncbi:SOS response-associated peptidase [Paenibacillus sp. 11B]|uniref:SOS response-associated peptidase n=1 Tax=Paenibacillus sp. 11B TaxID=3060965 RepID=UPI0026556CF2|nr:SOS response-associated peptidase [Paenibacillus sp. 11B]MDN8593138.1 SOS response-associated peptidase [Paenibacillus sp. 11B]